MMQNVRVRLIPLITNIDLPTVIKEATLPGDNVSSLFVATEPGQIWVRRGQQKLLFLDIRDRIGKLGANVPSLPGLGYPEPETYDERGLLGLEFHPNFTTNGIFYICYSNVNQRQTKPRPQCQIPPGQLPGDPCTLPYFFEWQVSTDGRWTEDYWDHVDHVEEWQYTSQGPQYSGTLISIRRPFFNHTGVNAINWSPEFNTLTLHLGDGGSEYDPYNLAQDDSQLNGKLLLLDLNKLHGVSLAVPVTSFTDLRLKYPQWSGAFVPLIKGLRNPNSLTYERDPRGQYIKYIAGVGQDTLEFVHAFRSYGLNFGFRPWEGIFPTSIPRPISEAEEGPGLIVQVGPNGALSYEPSTINAQVGDQIRFVWRSGPHTVTQSASLNSCQVLRGGFDSGVLDTGATFTLTIPPNAPPVIPFHCTVPGHCPPMRGRIMVGQAQQLRGQGHGEDEAGNRVILYPLEATLLPNFYRSFVNYTHLDPELGPRANTSGILYKGPIPQLQQNFIYTDFISTTQGHGLLLFSPVDRNNLQRGQPTNEIQVQNVGTNMFTVLGTTRNQDRIFLGAFSSLQFIKEQSTPTQLKNIYGGVYEVVPA